ncbi:sigma 54-interacting transcriptional regulator [Desulfovibrio sp. OttesenSCG-928-A18]|nr:sigma 54-interacting transcriptional regulator [Desulfovibrio sp. OttesenSCG-928-A18]
MCPASHFAFADILTVLDALPVGLLMVSPQGTVLHLNHSLSLMTGFERQAAFGLPCRHILRSRPCVSGCALGCCAFNGTGVGRAGDSLAAGGPREEGLFLGDFMERRDIGTAWGSRGVESDILTLKKRKVPVRLTHFPVLDAGGRELFRLDVLEDLTELKLLEQRLHQAHGHGRLIGRSAAMERISALIPSIAPSGAPVLITGETGTGKDILAETLHHASHRSREPFVRLNVSPLPAELLAKEFFGQAFPDLPERPGRFQQAAGGTLYITEIADLPKSIQARLVHFLDSGAFLPVGAQREISPNLRLISASNRDPAELVSQGILSGELFHRLNVVHIALPSLRERREDIDFLLKHFLDLYAARFKKDFSGFSPEARKLLASYTYPGNVRELKNIVEYAAMVCPGGCIGVDQLPAHMGQNSMAEGAQFPPPVGAPRDRRARKR